MKSRIEKVLKQLDVWQYRDRNPFDLSGGQMQRVAIASIYLGKKRIGEMIQKLSDDGKLVIVILHDMDFVSENFERVIVMAHGSVLADGRSEEVFAMDEVLKEARLEKPYMTQLFERFVTE